MSKCKHSTSQALGYGWFSSKSKALGNKTHIYLDKAGAQVEVTCVSRTSNHGSGWDDIVNVGQVCQWVKSIKNLTKNTPRRF
jgi:hypothetical protein